MNFYDVPIFAVIGAIVGVLFALWWWFRIVAAMNAVHRIDDAAERTAKACERMVELMEKR